MQTSSSGVRIFSMQGMRVSGSTVAVYGMLLAIFGVLLPWQKGLQFLDPVVLTAYACLGGVFAGPAAVQLFRDVPRSAREAVGRVAAALVFGEAIIAILLVLGLVTVRWTHPGIFPLDAGALIAGVAMGAALSLALSAMAAWVRMTYSESVARSVLRAALFALLIAFVFRSRWLPDVAWVGTGVGLAVAAVFLGLLAKRVRAHA